jgi:hypothetical protein
MPKRTRKPNTDFASLDEALQSDIREAIVEAMQGLDPEAMQNLEPDEVEDKLVANAIICLEQIAMEQCEENCPLAAEIGAVFDSESVEALVRAAVDGISIEQAVDGGHERSILLSFHRAGDGTAKN